MSDPLRALGDGWCQCFNCHRTWPIRDGERAEKCCDVTPAIYDGAYWEFVTRLGDD